MLIVATNAPVSVIAPRGSYSYGRSYGMRRRTRRGLLGAVTPAATDPASAAIAQVFPGGLTAQAVSTGPGGSISQANAQNVVTLIQQAASSRFIPWLPNQPWAFTCGSTTPSQVTAAKVGAVTGSGLKIAAAVDPEPISKGILAIASMFTGIFAGLFKEYHAQRWAAVCAAVPTTNQLLQQIDQGLSSGQMTPAQATSQYQSLQSQFSSAMHVQSYGRPNLVWVFDMAMQVAIAARLLDLQNSVLTGGAAAPWSTAVGKAAAAIGAPPLALLAAAAVALLLL